MKRSVALLCLTAALALANGVDAHKHHHHVKKADADEVVKHYDHGQVRYVVKKTPVKAEEPQKKQHAKHRDTKKKHPVKKHHHHREHVKEETLANGEIVRKYPHGRVRIVPKKSHHQDEDVAVQAKKMMKKHKKLHKKTSPTIKPKHTHHDEESEDVESENVYLDDTLGEGETVTYDVDLDSSDDLSLDVPDDASVDIYADEDVDVQLDEDTGDDQDEADEEDEKDSASAEAKDEEESAEEEEASGSDESEDGIVAFAEKEATAAAVKMTELASRVTGPNGLFKGELSPVIFVCSIVGALAAVVGITALAVSRVRRSETETNIQAVLAADQDVEAGVTTTLDEAADEEEDQASEEEHDEAEATFTNTETVVAV